MDKRQAEVERLQGLQAYFDQGKVVCRNCLQKTGKPLVIGQHSYCQSCYAVRQPVTR